ncbi:ABC transporter permease [candidate division KSB3 bacterium]|uniref:ABC transporter permease n=1 Tax=candidate division KSB3 bacterium TaxID=2044937 RepID=A0A2G6E6L3_9BACT|nr:MAG: ABC transporter permease [candidate division KSB3 bacterium]PIE30055.1 MAG: ABC transporter permease [candidate division KSB3 bacterium]
MAAKSRLEVLLERKAFMGILTPLIAITLAFIAGGFIILIFITGYEFTEDSLARLKAQSFPEEILKTLEGFTGRSYASRTDFNEALSASIASFQVTEQTLKQLKKSHVPDDILTNLLPLQERGIEKKNRFLKAVRRAIGKDNYIKYRVLISEKADQYKALRGKIIRSALVRENPLRIYAIIFREALGDVEGWGNVLFRATPLIFTGLAVAMAFQCGLFNIGGEGQMVIGGFAITWIGFTFSGIPAVLLIPLCILSGALAGALWGAIPGYLKARLGVHEVVNTIMMNWIAVFLVQYLTMRYRLPSDMKPQTEPIAEAAQLSFIHKYLPFFPEHIHLNTSILLAVAMVMLVWYLFRYTKLGYEIKAVGLNASAAECGGINVPKSYVIAMAISGAIAGMTGVNQVMGDQHVFRYDLFTELGFNGIGVALIGRNDPVGVVLGAILFSVLEYGGFTVSVMTGNRVPREIILMLKAIILIFVVVSGELTKRLMVYLQKKRKGEEE